MSFCWVSELINHQRLLQREEENWDQGCKWKVSLRMKTDHSFIKDRSRAEEDKNGEIFKKKGKKHLNKFVLSTVISHLKRTIRTLGFIVFISV